MPSLTSLYLVPLHLCTVLANTYSLNDCVTGISGGYRDRAHFCASIMAPGGGYRVRCWGDNSFRQLGTSTADTSILPAASRPDATFPIGKTPVRTFNGDTANCASFQDGTFGCWGKIPINTATVVSSESAYIMTDVSYVQDACIGINHLCVVASGAVRCSGDNLFGQIGSGASSNTDFPASAQVNLGNLGPGAVVLRVACGEQHTCALASNGKIKCWGLKIVLGLGLSPSPPDYVYGLGKSAGEMGDALPFVDLGASLQAVDISAHSLHTCALTSDSTVMCWGDISELGGTGVVGDSAGEMGSNLPPWNVGTLPQGINITSIHTGKDFLLSSLSNGEVRKGASTLSYDRVNPVRLTAWATAMRTICVVMRDYNIRCYGSNQNGALGIGTSADAPSFVDVPIGANSGLCGCPSGSILNVSGVPQCTACSAGNYSTGGVSTACSACEQGKFSPSPGTSSCTACSTGTFQGGYVATACSLCSKGTVLPSPTGTQCTACTPGKYSDVEGGTACSLCLAGTYSTTTGATSSSQCQPCAQGTFSNSNGMTVCTTCSRGSYSPSLGSTQCTNCLPGKFSTTPGATQESQCTNCPPGMYGPSAGASLCYTCGLGLYSGEGQPACTPCEQGKFSNASSNGVGCEPCPNASFSGGTGSSACTLCPPGTYSTQAELSTLADCTPCASGSVSGDPGSTHCDVCGIGEYASGDALVCIACQVGTFSNTTGAEACQPFTACKTGTFLVSP